jgi:hypothetical protein
MKMRSKILAAVIATSALVGIPAASASAAGTVSAACQSSNGGSTSLTFDLQCRLQEGPAGHYGYTGPVNGVMGTYSWEGVQRFLAANYGYTGPINGVPKTYTYEALQRWAADRSHGGTYTGPINGILGTNSWTGVDHATTYDYYSPGARL